MTTLHPVLGASATADLSTTDLVLYYFSDIRTYWAGAFSAVSRVRELPVLAPVPFDTSEPSTLPICNGVRISRNLGSGNAFYCLRENYIVYDTRGLVEDLRRTHGDLSVGVLMAHEYGHAIQNQADQYGPSFGIELQADCYSGAWARTQRSSILMESKIDRDLERVLLSYKEFSDPAGTDPAVAHGSERDRSAAFLHGFHAGVAGCIGINSSPYSIAER